MNQLPKNQPEQPWDPRGSMVTSNDLSQQAGAIMEQVDEFIDFRRIYFLIVKRLWIVAVVLVVGMIAMTGYVIQLPDIYTSRAVLQVDLKEKKILNSDDITQETGQTPDYLNTMVDAVTSGNVLLRVVKSLKLDKDKTFISQWKSHTDAELEVLMEKKIDVKRRRQSRVIDIVAEDRNPEKARDIASTVVKEFFREFFEQRMSLNRVASEFLSEEAEKMKKKLEQSELNLQRYKEENKAVSLEQNQNIIVTKLQEVNTAVTAAKNDRLKLESDIEQLKKVPAGDTDALLAISSVSALPQVTSTRQELLTAEADFGTLKEHYLPKHPKYIAAQNKIETIKHSLAEATAKAGDLLNQQYESAVQTENKLNEALKEQEAKALDLGKISVPYNVLSREVQTDRAMYESLVSRMKETGVEAGIESAPFHIIEEPIVPSKPSKPHRLRILMLSFFLLSGGSIVGIILWDMSRSGLRTVDDAESTLGLPVLGAIPNQNLTPSETLKVYAERERAAFPGRVQLAKKLWQRRKEGKKITLRHLRGLLRPASQLESEKEIITYPIALLDDPSSPLAESYRSLRASISLLGSRQETQVLLFTSAVPSEGKTFSSMNCAVAFAQQGEKTLLIDSDLRRPSLHHALLGGEERAGLSDYLSGQATLEECIVPLDRVKGLSVMSAGHRAPNPAELFSTSDLHSLVATLKEKFDRVIFDSAPINAVADTLYLAGPAGRVILVIRSEETPRRAITRCLTLLKKTGTKLSGLVLNRLERGSSAGYYYYYYGDKYVKDSVYGTGAKSEAGSPGQEPPKMA